MSDLSTKAIETIAEDVEHGNGCSLKALLDTFPALEDRLDAFKSVQQKHNELYPQSEESFTSGIPYRSYYVVMSVTGMEHWKTPGMLYGQNDNSEFRVLFRDKWVPGQHGSNSRCQNLTEGSAPHQKYTDF